jgi:hypothetical protein
VSSEDPERASDYLLESVNERAMAIGRQGLQVF